MNTVLVTEPTSFVGQHLAHHLLDENYSVRLLVRDENAVPELAGRGAETFTDSVFDGRGLAEAFDGVDGLFHVATTCRPGTDFADMLAAHVDGTRRILDAARDADVSRIVYAGSDMALGDTDGEICDESKRHSRDFQTDFERAIWEAHRLVEDRIDDGAPVVDAIVSTVYGPGRNHLVAEFIEHHLARRAVAHIDSHAGYTFTHVDDVARGLRLAYENGELRQRYLVSGTPASTAQLFELLSEQTDIPRPRVDLPDWLVDTVEAMARQAAPLFGRDEPNIRETIAMGRGATRYYSGQKTREQLDWKPRPLAEGLGHSLAWFRRREAQASQRLLQSTKLPLAGLTLFDIGLAIAAVVFPDLYKKLMHPHSGGLHRPAGNSLLARTGLLWLFFALVQGRASLDPVERPEWVMVAGALRLMDVPADIGYLLKADDLGWLGKAGLVTAPIFNLCIGTFLAYAGYRGMQQPAKSTSTSSLGPRPQLQQDLADC